MDKLAQIIIIKPKGYGQIGSYPFFHNHITRKQES